MSSTITIDARDAILLIGRKAARDLRRTGKPMVGDFVRFLDGSLGRFTYRWGGGIQTTVRGGQFGLGSFYLQTDGVASYSGSLDPTIPFAQLRPTSETVLGRFWFFHHDYPAAHAGIDVDIECQLFEEVA